MVEIKAVESLIRAHTARVISYLRAFDRPLGLLLNFQVPILEQGGIKRVVLTELNRARNLIVRFLASSASWRLNENEPSQPHTRFATPQNPLNVLLSPLASLFLDPPTHTFW